jgi:hypothetical protein
VPVTSANLKAFSAEVQRLAGHGAPPLYPAYRELLQAAYPPEYTVDSLLREPGAGFPDFTVSLGARLVNWVEVKHPGVAVDPLPAADAARFDRYREALPHIVLTNGVTYGDSGRPDRLGPSLRRRGRAQRGRHRHDGPENGGTD